MRGKFLISKVRLLQLLMSTWLLDVWWWCIWRITIDVLGCFRHWCWICCDPLSFDLPVKARLPLINCFVRIDTIQRWVCFSIGFALLIYWSLLLLYRSFGLNFRMLLLMERISVFFSGLLGKWWCKLVYSWAFLISNGSCLLVTNKGLLTWFHYS